MNRQEEVFHHFLFFLYSIQTCILKHACYSWWSQLLTTLYEVGDLQNLQSKLTKWQPFWCNAQGVWHTLSVHITLGLETTGHQTPRLSARGGSRGGQFALTEQVWYMNIFWAISSSLASMEAHTDGLKAIYKTKKSQWLFHRANLKQGN